MRWLVPLTFALACFASAVAVANTCGSPSGDLVEGAGGGAATLRAAQIGVDYDLDSPPAYTTIALVDTWVQVTNNVTSAFADGFSFATAELTAGSGAAGNYHVSCSSLLESEVSGERVRLGLLVDSGGGDALYSNTCQNGVRAATNNTRIVSFSCFADVSSGDVLSLGVFNDEGTGGIRFFGGGCTFVRRAP